MTTQIAFTMLAEDPSEGWDLYLLNTVDGGIRRLTHGMNATDFAWSPDGRHIVFVVHHPERTRTSLTLWPPQMIRNTPSTLYLMDVASGHMWPIHEDESQIGHIFWLPDGERLSFQVDRPLSELDVMSIDGSGLHCLIQDVGQFDWSFDGKRIVYWGYGPERIGLWVIDLAQSTHQQLTNYPAYESMPSWSPNGQQIAFIHFSQDSVKQLLYVCNADGSNLHQAAEMTYEGGFTWSPDSQSLAFIGETSEPSLNYALIVASASGQHLRYLAQDIESDAEIIPDRPIWSPDGQQIAFLSNQDEIWERLYLIHADGTARRCLTEGDRFTSPILHLAWQPALPHTPFS